MAVFSKIILSGSTNGQPIAVAASGVFAATAGTTIHTAVTGVGTEIDEVYLYAWNGSTAVAKVAVMFGANASNARMNSIIPAESGEMIVPGLPLRNGQIVGAKATAAGIINIAGWVNRIT
jgi:hypothetical protein